MTETKVLNRSSKEEAPWLGARILPDGRAAFRVWAPKCDSVELILETASQEPFRMKRDSTGYFVAETEAEAGQKYRYRLNGITLRPDPMSRYLPDGLHQATEIVDPEAYRWQDSQWRGLPLKDYIIYELHVGTFTPEGTFDAVIKKIPHLKELGVTCIELMPVAQFPGKRNWGYDGASPYAVQNSYGGPEELRRLVEACHQSGLAVCLDVVYNHLGPEGNCLEDFGYYFTGRYQTPWGSALNYDGAHCEPVRRYIIENALYWLREYHLDALRLDAIHTIYDFSASHLLAEMQSEVESLARQTGRELHLIAESDLNDSRVLRSRDQGGHQLAAQWSDDFHHSMHAILTGEDQGYNADFGKLEHLADALRKGFVYDGIYSQYRRRRHGNTTQGLMSEQFVICTQNHDQIGNREKGDRHAASIEPALQKLSAVALLLSPYLPMLFMGQEYGAKNPFPYFIDHADSGLIDAVRKGRRQEFAAFGWGEPTDPYAQETFDQAQLNWQDVKEDACRQTLNLYRDLIRLRKQWIRPLPVDAAGIRVRCNETDKWLLASFDAKNGDTLNLLLAFAGTSNLSALLSELPIRQILLDTAWKSYGGYFEKDTRHAAADLAAQAVAFI